MKKRDKNSYNEKTNLENLLDDDYDISDEELDALDRANFQSSDSSDSESGDEDLSELGLSGEELYSSDQDEEAQDDYDISDEELAALVQNNPEPGDIEQDTSPVSADKEETYNYYGIEQEKPRPAKKIVPKEQEKTRSLRMKRYKEHSLARYSNIYMIAGVIIGVTVFYFLVSPKLKRDYKEELREVRTSYNQTLSTKNNEIENLKLEKDSLTQKNEDYANSQSSMQTTIDNLTSEVEMLKQTIENGGLSVGSTDTDTDTQTATATDAATAVSGVATKNAAAERNNANVMGISGNSIEDMIDNE